MYKQLLLVQRVGFVAQVQDNEGSLSGIHDNVADKVQLCRLMEDTV